MSDAEGTLGGIAPRIQETKIALARAMLAVRRGDARAAELLLCRAQKVLLQIELGLPLRGGE
jgi:hypothetical protein